MTPSVSRDDVIATGQRRRSPLVAYIVDWEQLQIVAETADVELPWR